MISTLSFDEAIKEVIAGKKVTKKEWGDKRIYGHKFQGFLMIHKADGKDYTWIINDGDLLGNDWLLVLDN